MLFRINNVTIMFLLFAISITVGAQEFETINEDFFDNSRKWPIDHIDKSVFIKDSSYYIINNDKTPKSSITSVIIDPNFDYTIEAKITQLTGKSNIGFGIIWGKYLERDYLTFLIKSRKKYSINGKVNNDNLLIKNWKRKGHKIKKIGNSNILTIRKTKRVIKYYVNNKRIFSSDIYPIIGTEIGFTMTGKMSIKIDYLKVTSNKKTLNLVENSDNGYVLENLGPKVNSEYSERGPVISPDGKTLYITRTHPDNIIGEKADDIWLTTLNVNNEWSQVERANAPLNNRSNNFVISVTPDGNKILVGNTYKRDGSPDKSGISVASKLNNKWQVPEKQHIKNYENIDPYGSFFLSPDGTKLIISAENDHSIGDLDLYISFLKKNRTWTEPKNIGSVVNTFAPDFSPFLAADGKTLYFSSYGHQGFGSSDIFVSKRLDDTWLNWSEPKNMGPDINSSDWEAYYCMSAIGDYAYMVSGNKDISYGLEDIFKIKTIEAAKPDPVVMVVGKVFNKKTNELINAEIQYENLTTGIDEGVANATIEDGYKIVLPTGSSFGFRAVADDFYALSENIDLSDLKAFEVKKMDLYLVPIEKGQTFRLNNIFFEFDEATLKSESFPELNRLVELLKTNSEMNIVISGHTDDKGSDEYNLKLSQARAQSVMEYVIKKQISQNRISFEGFGESQPISTNDTEEGQQLNRRVEFRVL